MPVTQISNSVCLSVGKAMPANRRVERGTRVPREF
jgi:hypothetical protein